MLLKKCLFFFVCLKIYVTRIGAVVCNKLNVVHDDQVLQGVQIDNGTEYSVFVYQTNGSTPLRHETFE